MLLVGYARACLRWVLDFVRLVPHGGALFVLSFLLLGSVASLSLSLYFSLSLSLPQLVESHMP